eukprot:875740-Pyramimonas_sp.AAC.1
MSFADPADQPNAVQWHNPTGVVPIGLGRDAYPGMIPCVLGVDTVIGPVTGGCMVDVRVWNAAPSTQLTCQFGEMQTRAVFDTSDHILCETPASPSPQFATVHVSNNGGRFSNETAVGKDVQYLYMDSVLFLAGDDWSGANIDGVCSELVAKQMDDGSTWHTRSSGF